MNNKDKIIHHTHYALYRTGDKKTIFKGLNQRPNSDAEPVLPTKHTYTIYATRSHHYVLINISRARTHKSF